MAHEFETGFVYQTAAWHRLADIAQYRPTTWEEARAHYLPWEPERRQIYASKGYSPVSGTPQYELIPGWSQIVRSDNGFLLSIQEDSYAVIGNTEFGNLIEFAMGIDLPGMPSLEYETLVVLRGGRVIAVSLFMREPFQIPGDPSNTYGFMNFATHHDGTGGMKCGAGTFRQVCANTQRASEALMDRHGFAFNIRHTPNWATQTETARRAIVASVGGIEAQRALATEMAKKKVTHAEATQFVERWLPFHDLMTPIQKRNMEKKRDAFWLAYMSETCEGITDTVYGLSQAAVEVCDHVFPAKSLETRAARIMVGEHAPKQRALALARGMMS